jgi:hypothetical protein
MVWDPLSRKPGTQGFLVLGIFWILVLQPKKMGTHANSIIKNTD